VQRTIERQRVDAYVAALREQPGIFVMGAERHDGKWWVSGLRDPLAAHPDELLGQAHLDPARVVGRWEPYQALHPAMVLKRLQVTLSPPPSVALSLDGAVFASAAMPQHWADKARAFMQALACRRPQPDLSALKDVRIRTTFACATPSRTT
jgi:OOP family OmpA-OmpF porin